MAKATASSSGRTPRASVGTGTGTRPGARAAAIAPRSVGDSRTIGAPALLRTSPSAYLVTVRAELIAHLIEARWIRTMFAPAGT